MRQILLSLSLLSSQVSQWYVQPSNIMRDGDLEKQLIRSMMQTVENSSRHSKALLISSLTI
jgi:hypothetical protein